MKRIAILAILMMNSALAWAAPGYTLARIDSVEPVPTAPSGRYNSQPSSYRITYEIQPCAQNLVTMRLLTQPQPFHHEPPAPLPPNPYHPPGPYHGEPVAEPPIPQYPPLVEVVVFDSGIKCLGPIELVQGTVELPVLVLPGGEIQPVQPN